MKFMAVLVWVEFCEEKDEMCLHMYRMEGANIGIVKTRLFSKICSLTMI